MPPPPSPTATIVPFQYDPRRRARLLYFQGWRVTDIAELLGVAHQSVTSWRIRDHWDEAEPVRRVEECLEAKLCQIINKEPKDGRDIRDLDALGRQMERLARIRRYQAEDGHEGDLNPKIEARNDRPKKRKARNDLADHRDALFEHFWESLFPYQQLWWDNRDERNRIILKSRQIGATWYFAREALLKALDTGKNQIFLSASQDQANVFRRYIVNWVKEVTGVELKGDKKTIELANGATLLFLATNKATAQSYNGDLYFDEFFWVPGFKALQTAASGMASHKQFTKTYFSTPSSITHEAYEFWTGEEKNKRRPEKDRLHFDLSDAALERGIIGPDKTWRNKISIHAAARMGCDLFDIDELRDEYGPEQFANLYECEFVDDSQAVFPISQSQKMLVDPVEAWADIRPLAPRPYAGKVAIGLDPQDSVNGDHAGLVVLACPKTPKGKFRLIERVQFRGRGYEEVARTIQGLCWKYDVDWIAIDISGGYGSAILELVHKFFPRAKGYRYSPIFKETLVLKAQNVFRHGRFELAHEHVDVIQHFGAIRRALTAGGGQVTYNAGRTRGAGHADLAWAAMMAMMVEPLDGVAATNNSDVEVFE